MNEYTEYRIVIKPYALTQETEYFRISGKDFPPYIVKRELDKEIEKAYRNWQLEYIHIEKRRVENWNLIELHDPIFGNQK